jgi:hypothetical protein
MRRPRQSFFGLASGLEFACSRRFWRVFGYRPSVSEFRRAFNFTVLTQQLDLAHRYVPLFRQFFGLDIPVHLRTSCLVNADIIQYFNYIRILAKVNLFLKTAQKRLNAVDSAKNLRK